jgi:membrane fusion protein, multidrug efflux system
MKNKLRVIITVLIVLLISGVIFYPKYKPLLVKSVKGSRNTPGYIRQGQQRLNAVGYLITPVNMSELIKQNGTLMPDEEVDLAFETSGKIVSIYFTEGSHVKKGDLLAKINDLPLQAQLEKLQVQLKMAEAKEFRQRSLLNKDAISQESYDQMLTDVQSIKADMNLILARIRETELRAPFDGIIGLRYLSEGSYTTTATKIVKLIKTSPLKIEFSISEKYASEIKLGYPINFVVDDKTFEAKVYAINPKIDIDTRVITLRALYPNKNEELKPGVYTSVVLELSKISNTVSIPSEAVIAEMDGERVFVYKRGKAQSVKIGIGLRTESNIQVTDGLKFGDTLLTTGIMQLRQNLPVVLDTVIVNNQPQISK